MRRKMLAVLGAVAVASLAVSSSALARPGDRSVDQTYPVATAPRTASIFLRITVLLD